MKAGNSPALEEQSRMYNVVLEVLKPFENNLNRAVLQRCLGFDLRRDVHEWNVTEEP